MAIATTLLAGVFLLGPIETIHIADLEQDIRIRVCDAMGLSLSLDSVACVDPDEEPEDDWCANEGWYGDGVCDADCPQPDPDCSAPPPADDDADICAEQGWYGDGLCDEDCAQPDPDCASSGGGSSEDDICVDLGWYGDGICDLVCASPDPDCT